MLLKCDSQVTWGCLSRREPNQSLLLPPTSHPTPAQSERKATNKKNRFLKAMVSSTVELNWYTTNEETNISNKPENLLKISTSWKPISWRRRS